MAQRPRYSTPAYLVGLALIVLPLYDAITQVYPFRVGDVRWRFGSFGILTSAFLVPLVGLLVVFVTASLSDHRTTQRVIGVASSIFAVIVAGLLIMFMLDALQVRPDIKPAFALSYKMATGTALIKTLLTIVTFGSFGVAGFRAPKPASTKGKTGGGLVIGAKPGQRAVALPPDAKPVTAQPGDAQG